MIFNTALKLSSWRCKVSLMWDSNPQPLHIRSNAIQILLVSLAKR